MVVIKKDGTPVGSSPWITLNSDQTAPNLKIKSDNNLEAGHYIVTISSNLLNEPAYSPSFVFEIYLSPLDCLKNTISNGVTSIAALKYEIKPGAVVSFIEFDKFVPSLPACVLKYKLSIAPANAANLVWARFLDTTTDPLGLFKKSSTATTISSFEITDTAPIIKIGFSSTVSSTIGTYTMTLEVSQRDTSEFF